MKMCTLPSRDRYREDNIRQIRLNYINRLTTTISSQSNSINSRERCRQQSIVASIHIRSSGSDPTLTVLDHPTSYDSDIVGIARGERLTHRKFIADREGRNWAVKDRPDWRPHDAFGDPTCPTP